MGCSQSIPVVAFTYEQRPPPPQLPLFSTEKLLWYPHTLHS